MQNLQRDPQTGLWRIRKSIPVDLRAKLGKREFLIPLGTRDSREAKIKALPLLAQIEVQIAEARKGRTYTDEQLDDQAVVFARWTEREIRRIHRAWVQAGEPEQFEPPPGEGLVLLPGMGGPDGEYLIDRYIQAF